MSLRKFFLFFIAVVLVLSAYRVASPSLHNISYANLVARLERITQAWASDSPDDARLKAALQKRLLVPDPALLTVGPPSSGPLNGMSQRTVTINNGQGQ